MGKIPNFTDRERMKRTVRLKFTKTKNSISLDSRFVDLENTGFPATLKECSAYGQIDQNGGDKKEENCIYEIPQ